MISFSIWLLLCVNIGAGVPKVKNNNTFITIRVDNIVQLNTQIKNEIAPSNYKEQDISVRFNSKIIINETIHLESLNLSGNYSFSISLLHFNGIFAGRFKLLNLFGNQPLDFLTFRKTTFAFYNKHGEILGSSCDTYIKDYYGMSDAQFQVANKRELFDNYSGIFEIDMLLLNFMDRISFTYDICPIVFKKAKILGWSMLNIGSTLLTKNQPIFSDLSKTFGEEQYDLENNFVVIQLLTVFMLKLSGDLLNKDIFRRLERLYVTGTMSSISDDTFRPFNKLQRIEFSLHNTRTFLHSSNNKWLASLNSDAYYDPILWTQSAGTSLLDEMYQKLLYVFIVDKTDRPYDFPDDDFCLYSYLSHRQLIILGGNNRTARMDLNSLSCTHLYLVQYWYFINAYYIEQDGSDETKAFLIDAANRVVRCNFQLRLEACALANMTSTLSRQNSMSDPFTFYDLQYYLPWIELVGPIITLPIVCIAGFLSNLVSVLILTNQVNKKELFGDNRIFKFMLMNSVFNMIECFLSIFSLASECLGPNSIFCSSLMNETWVAYFRIYVVNYFGECMKTCSILTSIAFSLERYIATSADAKKSKFLQKFSKMNLNYFCLVILIVGMLTSFCKIFEFSTSDHYYSSLEYPVFKILSQMEMPWFQTIYILHYFLNDLVFLVINFIVDLKLFAGIRKNLDLKRKNLGSSELDSAGQRQNSQNSKKLDEIKKTQSNTNKLIVYSVVVYLFCRVPELVFYIHLITIRANPSAGFDFLDYKTFCRISLCYLMINIVQYLYMISYLTNFFFYRKFNKNFRKGFRNLIKRS